ncbi:MAG TPA: ATP-binding protein, partial [Candidatus Agathobaculum pullicola]|nr:ATP-binding protein [Candidatus Agathobaculum pullicola]
RLLRRLLENLTSNALQYNPAGTTLFFGLTDTPDAVRLTVADSGVGIPPELADTLFEPFVTGNQARTSGGGTGLGMAIAKKVAELHGGSIRLVHPPHNGWHTEFELTLPKPPQ